jgi:hypothetical protein
MSDRSGIAPVVVFGIYECMTLLPQSCGDRTGSYNIIVVQASGIITSIGTFAFLL